MAGSNGGIARRRVRNLLRIAVQVLAVAVVATLYVVVVSRGRPIAWIDR
jgi:hypothetical protein